MDFQKNTHTLSYLVNCYCITKRLDLAKKKKKAKYFLAGEHGYEAL